MTLNDLDLDLECLTRQGSDTGQVRPRHVSGFSRYVTRPDFRTRFGALVRGQISRLLYVEFFILTQASVV